MVGHLIMKNHIDRKSQVLYEYKSHFDLIYFSNLFDYRQK